MSPFTPKGEAPMWRSVYDHAVTLEPGDIIGWDRLEVLLGYDPSTPGASRSPINTASRRLLRDHSKLLVSVRGKGYRIAHASEQEGYARADQRAARRKVSKGVDKTLHVDRNALTREQQASLDAFHHVLAAQNAMLKRHDVRLATVESAATQHDARLDVLEATLKQHGIHVPEQRTVDGEIIAENP